MVTVLVVVVQVLVLLQQRHLLAGEDGAPRPVCAARVLAGVEERQLEPEPIRLQIGLEDFRPHLHMSHINSTALKVRVRFLIVREAHVTARGISRLKNKT